VGVGSAAADGAVAAAVVAVAVAAAVVAAGCTDAAVKTTAGFVEPALPVAAASWATGDETACCAVFVAIVGVFV
jgi:hypothetical protein